MMKNYFFQAQLFLNLLKQDVVYGSILQAFTLSVVDFEAGKIKMNSMAGRETKSLLNNKMFYNSVLSA